MNIFKLASLFVFAPIAGCDADLWYLDADQDGFGGIHHVGARPGSDWIRDGGDCDDGDAGIHPGVEESCNLKDDNCDGAVDEWGGPGLYFDGDGDGEGAGDPNWACVAMAGWVANATDCDDDDPRVFSGATERCDGLDNDCDESTPVDVGAQCDDGDVVDVLGVPTLFTDIELSFDAARAYCGDLGYHLPFVRDAEMAAALDSSVFNLFPHSTYWLGGRIGSPCADDSWSWVDAEGDCEPFGEFANLRGLSTTRSGVAYSFPDQDRWATWADGLGVTEMLVVCQLD